MLRNMRIYARAQSINPNVVLLLLFGMGGDRGRLRSLSNQEWDRSAREREEKSPPGMIWQGCCTIVHLNKGARHSP